MIRLVLLVGAMLFAAPAIARDSLGVFDDWAAFRDPKVPRCYAIAAARPSTNRQEFEPYASVGTWPKRNVRNQLHFRLSRQVRSDTSITVTIGNDSFALVGGGGDAWGRDKSMDAAIIAAMRSGASMRVLATDRAGNRFVDRYGLEGAATAMDAATVGCASRKR